MSKILGSEAADIIDGTSGDDDIKTFGGDDTVFGGGGADIVYTGTGDDELFGGDGDDYLVSNEGADILFGGAGSDRLFGCEDDDILDGGAGQDFLNAGIGNDRLIFTAAENLEGGPDYYAGLDGQDTLVLNLTQAEFDLAQNDIQAFLSYVAQTTDATGESDAPFFRFQTLNLAVMQVENLEVVVSGDVVFRSQESLTDDIAATTQSTAISGTVAANDSTNPGATYSLLDAPAKGTLTIDDNGDFSFDPGAEFISLADGVTETVSFTYSVIGANGTPLTATGIITVTGQNDAPVTMALSASGSEDATRFALDLLSGSTDVDAGDVLSVENVNVTVTGLPGPTIIPQLGTPIPSNTTLNDSELVVDLTNFQTLAVGETAQITVSFDVTDGTSTTPSSAVLTVVGANDAPTVGAAFILSLNDSATPATLDLLSGASDVDVSDVLSVSDFQVTSGPAGAVSLSGTTLSVDPSQVTGLAVGDSVTIATSFLIDDGNGGQVAQTASVTIIGTVSSNAPPVLAGPLTGAMTEDFRFPGQDVLEFNLLNGATDPDGDTLSVANLSALPFVTSLRNLQFLDVNPNDAAFQFLAIGQTQDFVLTYDVEDGNGGTVAQTFTLTVTGANDAPTTSGAVDITVTESDAAFDVDLLQFAEDVDVLDTLTILGTPIQTAGPLTGVTLGAGTLNIDPTAYAALLNTGQEQILSFTAVITDNNGATVEQFITVTIQGAGLANAAPVAGVLNAEFDEDGSPFALDLTSNATDADGDTLTASLLGSLPSFFNYDAATNTLSADPSDAAFQTLASGDTLVTDVSYLIEDGNGGSVARTSVITVNGVNDAPIAGAPVTFTVSEDANTADTVFDLTDGATDIDANAELSAVNVTVISGLLAGVSISGNEATIDPSVYQDLAAGETAEIQLEYDIVDGNGGTSPQTATITITGANDAPISSAVINITVSEGDAAFSVDLLQFASDIDATDTLSIAGTPTQTAGPATGVTLGAGSLDIDPTAYAAILDAGQQQILTFTAIVSDGNGGTVDQLVSVTIAGAGATNSPPVAGVLDASFDEDSAPFSLDLTDNATDPDGDILFVNLTSVLPSFFSFDTATNTLTADPTDAAFQSLAAGDTLVTNVSYTLEDGNGGSVARTSVITVNGVNDAPIAGAPVIFTLSEDADSAGTSFNLTDGATDIDANAELNAVNISVLSGDADSISFFANTASIDTSFYQRLAVNETAEILLEYDIIDGNGGVATQTATITVTGENDAPLALTPVTGTLDEDTPATTATFDLLSGAEDADESDTLSIVDFLVTSSNGAAVTLTGNTVAIDGFFFDELRVGDVEDVTVSYRIIDGNGGSAVQTGTFSVAGINDAPTTMGGLEEGVSEDAVPGAATTFSLLDGADDVDLDTSFSIENFVVNSGRAGSLAQSGEDVIINTSIFQDLAVGETEDILVSYDITDGAGGSVAQTATYTVIGANDAVTSVGDINLMFSELDAATSIDLLVNADDPDLSDMLSAGIPTLVSGNALGFIASTGGLDLDPNAYAAVLDAGDMAVVVYTVEISDGNGSTATQTINITIAGAGTSNSPPIIGPLNGSFTEDDSPFFLDLTDNITDPDMDDISITLTFATPDGFVFDAGTNGISAEPSNSVFQGIAAGETRDYDISYDISDGVNPAESRTTTITVTGTNDAPTGVAALFGDSTEGPGVFTPPDTLDSTDTFDLLDGVSDMDSTDVLSVDNVVGLPIGAQIVLDQFLAFDFGDAVYESLNEGEIVDFTVTYDVVDGNGGVVPNTFTLTVTGTNDIPVVTGAIVETLDQNTSTADSDYDLLAGATDVDEGNSLSVTNFTQTGGRTDAFIQSGAVLFVDAGLYINLGAGESDELSFSYDIIDAFGGSVSQTAIFTINGLNDAPIVIGPLSTSFTEDQIIAPATIDLLQGALDDDTNDILSVVNIGVIPPGFTITGTTVTFDPSNSAYQVLSLGQTMDYILTYEITDGNGGSVSQTLTATVTGVNDAPTGPNFIQRIINENTDVADSTYDLLEDVLEIDEQDSLVISNFTVTNDFSGAVTRTGNTLVVDGSQYAALNTGDFQTLIIRYDIQDGRGGQISRELEVRVEGVTPNGTPEVADEEFIDGVEDDAPVVVSAINSVFDPENDPLTVFDMGALPSYVTYDAGTQEFTVDFGDPELQSLNPDQTQQDTVEYQVTDGFNDPVTQIATFTVTGLNDLPVYTPPVDGYFVTESTSSVLFVLDDADDVDELDLLVVGSNFLPEGFTLAYSGVAGLLLSGIIFDGSSPAYDFLSDGEEFGQLISFNISDSFGGVTPVSVSVTITGVNDAPDIAGALFGSVVENTGSFDFNLLLNASDVEGDTLSVANFVADPSAPAGLFTLTGSTLTIDSTQLNLVSVPEEYSFTYDVADGNGGFTSQTITILGQFDLGTNTPPTNSGFELFFTEDELASLGQIDMLQFAEDLDGDNLTITLLTLLPDYLSFDPVNNLLIVDSAEIQTLQNSEFLSDEIFYTVNDGRGGEATSSIQFNIEGVNDAPVQLAPLTLTLSEDTDTFLFDLMTNTVDVDDGQNDLTASNITFTPFLFPSVIDDRFLRLDPQNNFTLQALTDGESATYTVNYDVADAFTFGGVPHVATLIFEGANDAPEFIDSSFDADENSGDVFITDLSLYIFDRDISDVQTVTNVSLASGPAGLTFGLTGGDLVIDTDYFQTDNINEGDTVELVFDVTGTSGPDTITGQLTVNIIGTADGDAAEAPPGDGPRAENPKGDIQIRDLWRDPGDAVIRAIVEADDAKTTDDNGAEDVIDDLTADGLLDVEILSPKADADVTAVMEDIFTDVADLGLVFDAEWSDILLA